VEYQQIAYGVEDGVATVTLDRPDQLNTFTARMREELIDAVDRVDADDSVRAVVVTGRGRAFCAGADLSAGSGTFDINARGVSDPDEWRDGGGQVTLRIFGCTKPVIAAINGPAVGVGATMTLPMDVRVAADTARFGFVFSRRGIVPEACSSWFLPRTVGISQALEWVLTGRVFDAEEALRGRLVRSVHPAGEVVAAATTIARDIAQHTSAVSVALSRQMLWRMLGASHPMEAHRLDSHAMAYMGRSADAAEGVGSFLEKRPPRFGMRVSSDMPPFYPWWTDPAFHAEEVATI
jgi:enoyl-CoA hydratase/carnithine racemase